MSYLKHIVAILATGFAASAFATPVTVILTSPTSKTAPDADPQYAGSLNYVTTDFNLNVSGWTYGSTTTSKTVCDKWNKDKTVCKKSHVENTTTPDNKAKTSLVGNFGASNGLGIEKTSANNHTADNEKGYFDMFLLSFSEMVSLNSINLGFISNDSDISILAFNGAPSQVSPLGKSWESLLGTGGWKSAGNYYDVAKNVVTGVNPLNISSQYWLVGAYNPALDTTTKDTKADYVKLKSITVSKTVKVPEPSALLLFGLGLLSLMATRRRAA